MTSGSNSAEDARHSLAGWDGLLALEAFFTEAPLGFALLDHDLRFLKVNPALARMNGVHVEDHYGRLVWEVVPGIRSETESVFAAVIRGGQPIRNVLIRSSTPALPTVEREWRVDFYPLLENRRVTKIGVICDEVTEQVTAERELAASETRLAMALQSAHAGYWESCPETGEFIASDEALRLHGLAPGTRMTHELALAAVHPDDRARVGEALQRTLETGEPYDIDLRCVRPDGIIWWLNSKAVLKTDGVAPRLVGLVQDITHRKAMEDVLAKSEQTLRHLVERSPFGIYVVDSAFRLAQVSDGAQKVFENVRPLIGRDFADVLRIVWQEPFASEAIRIFRHTLTTGEPYHSPSTVESRADNKTTEAYDWKIERIDLPDGTQGVVCHFYDLSERQRYEDHIKFLMKEVNHRSKNMLGLVQSIARQTQAFNADQFPLKFEERLHSLAAAQDLLLQHGSRSVPLVDLLTSQLSHFAASTDHRLMFSGPEIALTPSTAQVLGMALHELGTNAAKYGALSNDTGKVTVMWSKERAPGAAQKFVLTWKENGGPDVSEPQKKDLAHGSLFRR